MIEASKVEEKDAELTVATLDRVGPQPGVKAVAVSSVEVAGAASAAAPTAPAIDERAVPLLIGSLKNGTWRRARRYLCQLRRER